MKEDMYVASFGDREYWYFYYPDGVITIRLDSNNYWILIGVFKLKKNGLSK